MEYRSNFLWPCVVKLDGLEYDSVEHAYQAAKFLGGVREMFRGQGRDALTPGETKKLARTLKAQGLQRPDWEQVNLPIMEDLVRQKFQKPELRKLLAASDDIIVEGNYWHDCFWGACYCDKCASKPKLNHLGKILMKIREEIKHGIQAA
jgi:ribA/ribD-fused uncharacterized protein